MTEEIIAQAHVDLSVALSRAGWLAISLEHMLLALDYSGLSGGILDLTIALESLIRSETEISFRFSHQIGRLASEAPSEVEDYQALLGDLYDVRSKLVHGNTPRPSKLGHVRSRLDLLHKIMKDAVAYAIRFHARNGYANNSWNEHLNKLLHGTTPRQNVEWGSGL